MASKNFIGEKFMISCQNIYPCPAQKKTGITIFHNIYKQYFIFLANRKEHIFTFTLEKILMSNVIQKSEVLNLRCINECQYQNITLNIDPRALIAFSILKGVKIFGVS